MNTAIPSRADVEARIEDLCRRRDELDRMIADHRRYLELGERLLDTTSSVSSPAKRDTDARPAAERKASGNNEASRVGMEYSSPETSSLGDDPMSDARRRGRALICEVVAILDASQSPLHVRTIWQGLAERGFSLPGKDPVAALNTRLWKRCGENGAFQRLGDAVYTIRRSKAEPASIA